MSRHTVIVVSARKNLLNGNGNRGWTLWDFLSVVVTGLTAQDAWQPVQGAKNLDIDYFAWTTPLGFVMNAQNTGDLTEIRTQGLCAKG